MPDQTQKQGFAQSRNSKKQNKKKGKKRKGERIFPYETQRDGETHLKAEARQFSLVQPW
jgi:hypothetical protein